jgi:parallel beta-helix repeat protein
VTLILTVVLILSLFAFQHVKAESNGTIYIRADGSLEGTDKIQLDGNVYTFTGDIYGSIIVEKDNVVVDGAGYVLQPQGDASVGVDIRDRNHVTVRNLTIKGFLGSCAILLINAVSCNIIQNDLNGNLNGVEMTGASSHNVISENRVQNNEVGMEMYSVHPGSDNTISENEVVNNTFGMQIRNFVNTNVLGNRISANRYGLGLGLGSGSIAKNNVMDNNTYGFRAFNVQAVNVDVDTSNTVNGKPIICWVNQHNKTVPTDACYVALIGCTGITVKNLNLNGNLEGVFLGSTTNSAITNNRLSNNLIGINFDAASNNMISGNHITGNENGINLRWKSTNNTIQGNHITANAAIGIYIAESYTNSIIGNNIANNDVGVFTEYCGKPNIFHHNNFVNNTEPWDDIGFTPWPIPLPISTSIWDDGEEGNFWSGYSGEDADGDGIGDTPYVIGTNNTDCFPLMSLVDVPELPDGNRDPEPFPTIWVVAIAAVVVVGVGCIAYFAKFRKKSGKE